MRRRQAAAVSIARALLGVCLLVASCGESHAGDRSVRVGVVLPLTGDVGQWGNEVLRGVELALVGREGEVELVCRDDQADPTRTAELVQELVTSHDVAAIIGSVPSPCCLAAAERVEALGVPLITPSGTHKAISEGREWVFRMCFSDPQQGEHMARFARMTLGLENAVVLKEVTNDYSIGLAEAFSDTFLRFDGSISAELNYRAGRVDPDSLLRALGDVPFDLIYIPGYFSDVGEIIDATAPIWTHREVTFLGGDGWESSDLRDSVERWPEEVYYTTHFASDEANEVARTFIRSYREASDADAAPGSFAALGYDTALLLSNVIRSGARTRAAIRAGLRGALPGFEGATGSFSVSPVSSEPRKNIPVMHWSGSEWVAHR